MDVWLKRDIAHVLMSQTQTAVNSMRASGRANPHYIAGFQAAVAGIALAFGIAPGDVLPRNRALRTYGVVTDEDDHNLWSRLPEDD